MTTTKPATGWPKYHTLRYDKGSYSYECDSGLFAGGPWDNRPKRCKGIGCGRELVEQSTLDAAIEQARAANFEQLAALQAVIRAEVHRQCAHCMNGLRFTRDSRQHVSGRGETLFIVNCSASPALRNALGPAKGDYAHDRPDSD